MVRADTGMGGGPVTSLRELVRGLLREDSCGGGGGLEEEEGGYWGSLEGDVNGCDGGGISVE
jgi:hypothetical protein